MNSTARLITWVRIWIPFVLGILRVDDGYAQAVSEHMQYEHPARTVTHDISLLQNTSIARVAVVHSSQTIARVADGERLVNQAVFHWELFLSGLQIPYVVLDDADLDRSIPRKLLVLVLPAVESISEKQQAHILDFVRSGGGIIASGRTGLYDENGWRGKGKFLRTIFGVEYLESLPAQPFGIFQTIENRSSLSAGIPPGFWLNLAPRMPTSAVRAGSAKSLGSVKTYEADDQTYFDDLTMMVMGSHGHGRFVWTGFLPQDIARKRSQQENYQRLMINALAHVSGSPTVLVARWPGGRGMALTIAALPSPGFDGRTYLANMGHLLTLIEEARVPASFYFASDEITTFPGLYRRAIESGSEIGLTADSDDLLIDSTVANQTDRLLSAARSLRLSRAHGVYPPGGFLDGNTIRALDNVGAAYVIGTDARTSVPGILDWWEFVDFHDSFQSGSAETDEIMHFSEADMRMDEESGSKSKMGGHLSISTIPLATSFGIDFEAAYDHVKESGGHLVLPFYPEQFGRYSRASDNLRRTLEKALRDNTWITTASDALIWWRTRAKLNPILVSSGQNELHIILENSLDHSIHDVVLEVYLHRSIPSSIRVSSPARLLRTVDPAEDAADSIRIHIPDVKSGRNRIEISWQR